MNMKEIQNWLEGKGKWSLRDSKLDKQRLKFRQNLLILLDKYVKHQQINEEKSNNFTEEKILRENKSSLFGVLNYKIIGCFTHSEETDFRDIYLLKFSKKPLIVEFFISKEQASQLIKKYGVPDEIEEQPKLKKPTKEDIENAAQLYIYQHNATLTIKIQGKFYHAKTIYYIALRIANDIKYDISMYYHTNYKKELEAMGY